MGLFLPVFRPVPHSHSLPPRQTTHVADASARMAAFLTHTQRSYWKTYLHLLWCESNFCAWGWLVKGWTCDSSSGQGKGGYCAFGLSGSLARWLFSSLTLWLSGSLSFPALRVVPDGVLAGWLVDWFDGWLVGFGSLWLSVLYVCMYVCMYVCIYVCMYACMYVYMYVFMYVCMHSCMFPIYTAEIFKECAHERITAFTL